MCAREWCSLLSKEGLWCAFLYVVEVRDLLFLGVPLLESEMNKMTNCVVRDMQDLDPRCMGKTPHHVL